MNLLGIFIFSSSLIIAHGAMAEITESDKLCNYIHNMIQQVSSQEESKKIIREAMQEIPAITDLRFKSLKEKKTFEQFKKEADALLAQEHAKKKKTGQSVNEAFNELPISYKRIYLMFYRQMYCGGTETEASIIESGGKEYPLDRLKFDKQLNVAEHPYYKELKAKEYNENKFLKPKAVK
ncbi:MAG: hypothetical protein ACXVCP_19030 [Bdellovibrio sp.]